MKHKVVILLLLIIQFAKAQNRPPYIKVISATTQDWISGAPGGRSGTTYNIKVGIQTGKPITFKNMWLGKQQVTFDVQTYFTDPNKKPGKGDSVLLVYVKPHAVQTENTDNKPLPIEYKGEALVEYLIEGQLRYFIVKKFSKLEIFKGR
jgi:hypothetical protein